MVVELYFPMLPFSLYYDFKYPSKIDGLSIYWYFFANTTYSSMLFGPSSTQFSTHNRKVRFMFQNSSTNMTYVFLVGFVLDRIAFQLLLRFLVPNSFPLLRVHNFVGLQHSHLLDFVDLRHCLLHLTAAFQ